jgi:hypothetical protein
MDSGNIAARLNLPNMAFHPDQKIGIYTCAQEGLVRLEKNIDRRIKYAEYIDHYANMNEEELKHYREEYLPKSPEKEEIMGLHRMFLEEGKKEGMKEGKKEGKKEAEILMLGKLVARRFGTVPVWAEDRLRQAEEKELEIWMDRILDAGSVEELFTGGTGQAGKGY